MGRKMAALAVVVGLVLAAGCGAGSAPSFSRQLCDRFGRAYAAQDWTGGYNVLVGAVNAVNDPRPSHQHDVAPRIFLSALMVVSSATDSGRQEPSKSDVETLIKLEGKMVLQDCQKVT